MSGAFWSGAFSPAVFYCDAVASAFADRGDWPSVERHQKKRKRKEGVLDLAIAKATEPKRRKVEPPTPPWLADPIAAPVPQIIPEFNPALAALAGRASHIQSQLDLIAFNRSQEEADLELLLLSF